MSEAGVGKVSRDDRPGMPATPPGGRETEAQRYARRGLSLEAGDGMLEGGFDRAGREAMSAADRAVRPGTFPSWRFWALVLTGMAMVGAAAVVSLA